MSYEIDYDYGHRELAHGEKNMTEKKMTPEAAARIQANADKTGKNQDFKARAQAAGEKNSQK